MKLDYSVVIRTLGLAGEKYQRMLNAIAAQTIQPREIVVVLAEGYALPPEQLGYERFVYCKKGIVTQRSFGTRQARGEYCLFLDDDMDFAPNMVEELFKPIQKGIADVTFPLLTEMLPQKGIGKIVSCLTASAIPLKGKYTRIIRSGGWSYNNKVNENSINYYEAETAPGGCYLASREAALKIRFEEEDWLELTSFSLPDDQINFYKYYKLGYKIIGISGIELYHLDGAGKSPERRLKATYSLSKHHIIFWHRFIYKNDNSMISRFISILCFSYWIFATILFNLVYALTRMYFKEFKISIQGLRDGFKFINSEKYKSLPIVNISNYK